jgi:hypothetical protein
MAKSFWSEKEQRLVSIKTSTPVSEHDALPFPGNRPIAQIPSDELVRILQALEISGVSPSNPREANLAAYAFHLNAIGKRGSDEAIANFIRGNGSLAWRKL